MYGVLTFPGLAKPGNSIPVSRYSSVGGKGGTKAPQSRFVNVGGICPWAKESFLPSVFMEYPAISKKWECCNAPGYFRLMAGMAKSLSDRGNENAEAQHKQAT